MLKAASPRLASEDETLLRAQSGDMAAFHEMVTGHRAMVFSIASHFVRDRAVAEELAQDVFLTLYRSLGSLESAAHLTFWLRRVTSHRCIDWQRQATHRLEVTVARLPEQPVPPTSRDPLRGERLRRLVSELPAPARMVVILRYQEDIEPQEIADIMNMPVNTVKSHLRRALAALRERFAEEEKP